VAGIQSEAAMTYTFFAKERLILGDPTDPRLLRRVSAWDQITAALTSISPDFFVIAAFCAIGLLLTFALGVVVPGG
jgi:hypothetical protein